VVPAYLGDPADLALVRGAVARSGQGALLNGAPAVQGHEGGAAQVERVVGVVVQLVGVRQGLLAGRQNLARLDGKERFVRNWFGTLKRGAPRVPRAPRPV